MVNKKINLNISADCKKLKKKLKDGNLPEELSDLSNKIVENCSNMQKKLNDISETITDIQSISQKGGGKSKKVRKHIGIHQTGGKTGKLKKGYKYSGKKLKNGLPQIVKAKSKKNKKQTGGEGLHPPPLPPYPYPPHPHPYPYPYPYPYPVMRKKTEVNK
jgi:hypothetical protein